MEHEYDYNGIITAEGPLVFVVKTRDGEPNNPFILLYSIFFNTYSLSTFR